MGRGRNVCLVPNGPTEKQSCGRSDRDPCHGRESRIPYELKSRGRRGWSFLFAVSYDLHGGPSLTGIHAGHAGRSCPLHLSSPFQSSVTDPEPGDFGSCDISINISDKILSFVG